MSFDIRFGTTSPQMEHVFGRHDPNRLGFVARPPIIPITYPLRHYLVAHEGGLY